MSGLQLTIEHAAETVKASHIHHDEITRGICKKFDYPEVAKIEFRGHSVPFGIPDTYSIGLIVGPSGSGKTSLLHQFSSYDSLRPHNWDQVKSVASHFGSSDAATELLTAVGLNSIPCWLKPYHVLSNGEQFRANVARSLYDGASPIIIDEFTSVVDRSVASAVSACIRRWADTLGRDLNKKVILASCHYDIIQWLEPDWVFDLQTGNLSVGRFLWQRPSIEIEVFPCDISIWGLFKDYHYLTSDINKGARCFCGFWGENLCAFGSSLALPSGTLKNSYRGHRTVVLPDYQGLGIGVRFSDAIAEIHKQEGYRYFSKTTHPRMGQYRERSSLWRSTSQNMRQRNDDPSRIDKHTKSLRRVWSYSHEYIGGGR